MNPKILGHIPYTTILPRKVYEVLGPGQDVPLLDMAMRESAMLAQTSGVLRGPWDIFQEYIVEDIIRPSRMTLG